MEKDVQQPASEEQPQTQKTFKGHEIPVPTKAQVFDFFKTVVKAVGNQPT